MALTRVFEFASCVRGHQEGTLAESGPMGSGRSFFLLNYFRRARGRAILTRSGCGFLLTTQGHACTLVVNINFGQSKSIIIIFTKIIFAIELEFVKSAKFTACENFALYGIHLTETLLIMCVGVKHKIEKS